MENLNIVLANDNNGEKITLSQVQEWVKLKSKTELSNFFYYRFYGRYLKPFDFENSLYKKSYKNGFSIMANCCLLIETYISFSELLFLETNFKSERCFGYFFLTQKDFYQFSRGGLTLEQYKDVKRKKLKNKGIPFDFYKNVRCGILHNGETKNNWKIVRKGCLFDEKNKRINAYLFMEKLKNVLNEFRIELKKSDLNSIIWKTYLSRLEILVTKSIKN